MAGRNPLETLVAYLHGKLVGTEKSVPIETTADGQVRVELQPEAAEPAVSVADIPVALLLPGYSLMGKMGGSTSADYVVAYDDEDENEVDAESTEGTMNGTSEVTLLAAPATGQRVVYRLFIANTSGGAATASVWVRTGSTDRYLAKALPLEDSQSLDLFGGGIWAR